MKKATVLVLALVLMGCADPYGACVKGGADIASAIGGGYNTVVQLQQQGTIDAAETVNVAGYLKFANDADKVFLDCAEAAHTGGKAGAFTACVNSFATQINSPQEAALVHVANPAAQATLNSILKGITTGVSTLATALGGA